MSEAPRKRSRKSKLELRECSSDDDDLNLLQIKAIKLSKPIKQYKRKAVKTPKPTTPKIEEVPNTSVLKKINASANHVSEPKSPRVFEVNIEVESCDDDDFDDQEDRLSPMIKDPLLIRKNKSKKTNPKPENHFPTPIRISHESILNEADNIIKTSTNIADRILNICLRNSIGQEMTKTVVRDYQEKRIQIALDQWRTWQFRSFYREDPVFYKCYVCMKSWWHLSDFRDHLSEHEIITISLENYELHESNIIAHNFSTKVPVKDIYTEGLCYRCGRDFYAHNLESRVMKKHMSKNGCCIKQFYTCNGFRDHMPCCYDCNVANKPFKCDICKSKFDTEDELSNHLVLSHSVRSDIPIMTRYKTCKQCLERLSCSYSHTCGKKSPHSQCLHCFKSFPNRMALENHLESSVEPCTCEVCGEEIKWSCQIYEHMLSHTDKFMIVSKCVKCVDYSVFINRQDVVDHRLMKHESKDKSRQNFFPKMLVPSSCVYKNSAESKSVPKKHKSVLKEQKSISKEQKSISKEKESTPKEKESIPKENESAPIIQESLLNDTELVPKNAQKSIQEEQQSPKEYTIESLVVKEEPEDLEESPRLVVKEELFEEVVNKIHAEQNLTNFEHQIQVKEEYIEEESNEYEEEIIRLNFDGGNSSVKQEPTLEEEEEREEYLKSIRKQVIDDDGEDDDLETSPSEASSSESERIEKSLLERKLIMRRNQKPKKLYRCTKCGYSAKHQLYKEHILNNCIKTQRPHKTHLCTKCNVKFVSLRKYLRHIVVHDYKYLSCPECLKQFHCFTKLGQHIQVHIKQNFVRVKLITHAGRATIKPDYKCKQCGEFSTVDNFFQHWELHVPPRPVYKVKVTSKPHKCSGTKDNLIKESIVRLGKSPKECNQCLRQFNRVNECKRHIIEHLLAEAYILKHTYDELRCQICDAGFPTAEKYKYHMRNHASLPVYKCELCDRTFSDSSNFTKHKKVHNLKVILCDLCGKKFQSSLALKRHLKMHKNSDPVTCNLCNKIFHFESSYRRHIRYYHEKVSLGFRCVICSERFVSLRLKWDHMWEVHKERKQKADCPICYRSFRKYGDVRAHAKTEHSMDVSIVSVKNATNGVIDVKEFLKNTSDLGKTETLIVYESDG